jgi:hypothetical protein
VYRNDTQQVLWHTCKGESIRTKDEFLQYIQRRREEVELNRLQDAAYKDKMNGVLEYLRGVAEDESLGRHRQK